jgi:serine/threonine protein kinase
MESVLISDQDITNTIARGIQKGKIKINHCELLKMLKRPRVRQHKGNSDTIGVFGNLNYTTDKKSIEEVLKGPIPVSLKISFKAKHPRKDNSLEVEIQIYKTVVNTILSNHFTPNVVAYYGSFDCNLMAEVKEHIKDEIFVKIEEQIKDIRDETSLYDFDVSHFLLMENVNGGDLLTYLLTENSTDSELYSIIFQVLYTCQVFNLYNLRHNDLHISNILLEEVSSSPTFFVYFVTDTVYFAIPVSSCAKLFDFDMSSVVGVETNTTLDRKTPGLCKKMGVCNEANPKFDAFVFLGYLYDMLVTEGKNEPVKTFIESVIDVGLLNYNWPLEHRPCKRIGEECDGNWIPSEKEMKSVSEMLFTYPFLPFKHELPDFDPRFLPQSEENLGNIYFMPTINKSEVIDGLFFSPTIDITFTQIAGDEEQKPTISTPSAHKKKKKVKEKKSKEESEYDRIYKERAKQNDEIRRLNEEKAKARMKK